MNLLSNTTQKRLVVLLVIASIHATAHTMSRLNRDAQRILVGLYRRMSTAQAADLLQVAPDAPDSIVRTQYKKLAKIHHPDTGGNAQNFANIKEAYESLLKSRDPLNLDYVDAREQSEESKGCVYPCSYWNEKEKNKFRRSLLLSRCIRHMIPIDNSYGNSLDATTYQRMHSDVKERILQERKQTARHTSQLQLAGISTPAIHIKRKFNNEKDLISRMVENTSGPSKLIDCLKAIEKKIWETEIWYKIRKKYPNITPKTHDYECHQVDEKAWSIAIYPKNNSTK